MNLEDVDCQFHELVATIPPAFRSAMLAVLKAPEHDRPRALGELYTVGLMPATVELLIDAEEDSALRAVLVGMLREA